MSKYIVIPDIQVSNANAQPVWWIVGAPAITAYAGFAHALALRLGSRKHEGVAIVHHDLQFLGEQISATSFVTFLPQQFRASGLIDKADYVAGGMSLSSQPTARCHLNVSLVIAMPEDVKISSSSVETFLRGARIAGGTITRHGEVYCGARNHGDALGVIRKNGYSIVERQDLMVKQDGDRDMIDVLFRHTRRYAPASGSKVSRDIAKDTGKNTGWIMPTCLGYIGISAQKKRNGARHELPHLYVEPLIGLVQYKRAKDEGLHFWRYSNPMPTMFIVSTHQGALQ